MIYKFKCKATGDLIMLAAQGDLALRLMGREPAVQGIIEAAAMPAAMAALQAAIAAQEAAAAAAPPGPDEQAREHPDAVALRRRLWPLIDTLRRAHEAGVAVVWGV